MRKIGFKNFRKFVNFPSLELAPITFMVGANNAGKSTVVKGLLALSDFLKSGDKGIEIPFPNEVEANFIERKKKKLSEIRFYFNSTYLAHIGTFRRALYNRAENDTIVFSTRIGSIDVDIDVVGNGSDEELVWGIVSVIKLHDRINKITMSFDLKNDFVKMEFNIDETEETSDTISANISKYWDGDTGNLIRSLVESLAQAIHATLSPSQENQQIKFDGILGNITVYSAHLAPIENVNAETKVALENVIYKDNSGKFKVKLSTSISQLDFELEYIYAHGVSQKVIYSSKDTNDYLSRTIHDFVSTQRLQDNCQKEFILEWMEEFGIGVDYSISSFGGEAYVVKITNNDGDIVNLADKGIGSIQLMTLLFRLAIDIPCEEESKYGEIVRRKLFVIEEPEQNLHPMLQSKLADLFFKLNKDYGFSFLVETHSEYLIRRSQVIVKDNFNDIALPFKDNSFKVYYFNTSIEEKAYYEIKYQKDGNFSNDFGQGFFDEASNLAFEIL